MTLKVSKYLKIFVESELRRRYYSNVSRLREIDKDIYRNEPILHYRRCSKELKNLERAMVRIKEKVQDVPIVINGKKIKTDKMQYQYMPHSKKEIVATYCFASEKHIQSAIESTCMTQRAWSASSLTRRIGIWEAAAHLMAKKYRGDLVASIMFSQAKTLIEAEKDVVKLINYSRLNACFLRQLAQVELNNEETSSGNNFIRFQGLDGFVAAISPFCCTGLAFNLAFSPSLMGCGVLWKPSRYAVLSNWWIFEIMRQAGLPDGVLNFVPADRNVFLNTVLYSPWLAGVSIGGSNKSFYAITQAVAKNISNYKSMPRIVVDNCLGRNFHFIHRSAEIETVLPSTIRAAFEFSGQKQSSCSHLYVSEKVWNDPLKHMLIRNLQSLVVSDVANFKSSLSAVINEATFSKIYDFIEETKIRNKGDIITGGMLCSLKGFFVDPTVVVVRDPRDRLLRERVPGPILIVYPYRDKDLDKIVKMILYDGKVYSGAVFATDSKFLSKVAPKLSEAATHFFVNDMSTEDRISWPHHLFNWTVAQYIRNSYIPPLNLYYPYMNIN